MVFRRATRRGSGFKKRGGGTKRLFRRHAKGGLRRHGPTRRITQSKIRNVSVPDELWTKFSYQEHGNLANANGSSSVILHMRGNSIYDPDATNAGHEAMNSKGWKAMYSLYYVAASSIEIEIVNLKTDRTCQVTILPGIDIWSPNSVIANQIQEQPYASTKMLSIAAGGTARVRFKRYHTTAKVFGHKKPSNEDVFWGTIGSSNPGSGYNWYWAIAVADTQYSTTAANVSVDYRVKMKYYTKLFKRVDAPQSGTGATGSTGEDATDLVDKGPSVVR